MKTWQKFVMILLIGSFPLALVLFQRKTPWIEANLVKAQSLPMRADLESVFRAKETELADIDMKIVTARGEILKFDSRRQELLKDLQMIQERIRKLLEVNASSKRYEDK